MHNTPPFSKLLLVLAFASIYIIWGSTFLAISYGLRGFPPFLLAGIRFAVAGLVLLAWRHIKGEGSYSLANWRKNAITGILILTGGTGLVMWGEQYISSTEAAIAIATGPFWFIAIDRKNWKHYFSKFSIVAGLIIGFAGLLLFLNGSVNTSIPGISPTLRIIAFSVLALSSVSWVLGALYSKKNRAGHSTIRNAAQQLVVAGLSSFLIAGFRGEYSGFSFATVPFSVWIAVGFLVIFGSILAYLSYIWLLSVQDPVVVSTHTYINPVVAVIAGWLLAGEGISTAQSLGLGIILLGVLLTNSSHYKIRKRTRVRFIRFIQTLSSFPKSNEFQIEI